MKKQIAKIKLIARHPRGAVQSSAPRGWNCLKTKFGNIIITASEVGVTAIKLAKSPGSSTPDVPAAHRHIQCESGSKYATLAAKEIDLYLQGKLTEFKTPVDVQGMSPFQLTVIARLQKIKYGQTVSYGQLAALAGNAKAYRAAATAVARNPIPIIIPCHRVIKSDGTSGEYSFGGVWIKVKLLDMERG